MTRPNPQLRAAILAALPHTWVTAREFAKAFDLWASNTIQAELCILAKDGVIAKRVEVVNAAKWIGFYRKHEVAHANPA